MPPKFARENARRSETKALLDDSDEEDFFLEGPSVRTDKLRQDPKLNRLRNQVDDVVDVMKDNVSKVMERGDRLEDLQDKSDSLSSNSDMFRSRAKDLRKNMWWKNCRMKLLLALVIFIILCIIVIPIIMKSQN